ncbi:glucose-methanol-choline oxidoreductase [Botrytis cinerea]
MPNGKQRRNGINANGKGHKLNGVNGTTSSNGQNGHYHGESGLGESLDDLKNIDGHTQSNGHCSSDDEHRHLDKSHRIESFGALIGSGYGGSVAASRMARAGQSVCLLERGKEKWPGEYPSGTKDTIEELHVSGNFAPGILPGMMVEEGDPTGLYHLIFGKADKDTLAMDCWPKELREEKALKEYYNRAASVLQPQSYPEDWPALPKLTLLEKQARILGMHEKFYRPPQTTRFLGGPNSTGVEMYPSALTGMDSTGVNDGSKSSTLVNYLSDAWNWGAEMFCECEVRYVKKHPDPKQEGYLVCFAWHGSNRGSFKTNIYEDLLWVHAKKCVFLGAGSIGSTEILLRSRSLGMNMSDRLGKSMSGNGDMLAFGYNTDEEVNAIGRIIDNREGHANVLDGYVIEEGAIPKALAPLFQFMLEKLPGSEAPADLTTLEKLRHTLSSAGSRFLGPYYKKGSIERTQTYLVMSHDTNQAILTLKDDKPSLEFLGVGRSDHVRKINNVLKEATEAVGGTFVNNPFYAALGQQEITVHPIGGACMSSDNTAQYGVTNHFGEILTGNGSETYPGLIVSDAAVIPCALGVNPFATITALAERSVAHAAKNFNLTIDYDTSNGLLDLFGEPKHAPMQLQSYSTQNFEVEAATKIIDESEASKTSGFGFTEVMEGFVHIGKNLKGDHREDYEIAAKTARGLCEASRFFLSVKTFDTRKIVHRADHSAMLTGTFVCASLPGSPFMVQRGDFQLFNVDHQAPGTRNLTYDFDMTSTDGKQLHFHGFKIVDSSVALGPLKFWTAASTLYVTITEKDADKNCTRKRNDAYPTQRFPIANLHTTVIWSQSANLFFAPFTYLQYPSVTYTGYINDTPPDDTIQIVASDNVKTLLHVWEPRNPNIETKNLFFIPGASVDHQIFALPTIEVNAINYFTRAGYRCFVVVHRICQLIVAENNWTTFDARLDIKASLQWIRKEYGHDPIYTIAHCMGSVAFSSGLLDGTIPANWILGVTCSQVFMNPIWATLNLAKALAGPIPFDKLYKFFGGNWFSCSSTKEDSYFQQAVNQLLRFYPDKRCEICNNVSCHRCSLIFGRLWNHNNLNEATHRQINRFFSGVNMTCLHLLMRMGTIGHVTGNAPLFHPLTSSKNIRRLKDIPFFLFSGSDNKVLNPESTTKTLEILREENGGGSEFEMYERTEIRGYGHLDCWMGREAYKDVYPEVRERVDRVCRGREYRFEGSVEGKKGI